MVGLLPYRPGTAAGPGVGCKWRTNKTVKMWFEWLLKPLYHFVLAIKRSAEKRPSHSPQMSFISHSVDICEVVTTVNNDSFLILRSLWPLQSDIP